MKCVCGYEHKETGVHAENPPFIDVDVFMEGIICDIKIQDSGPRFGRWTKYLKACPKCGTLKIDI